jgi:hypothetical protein
VHVPDHVALEDHVGDVADLDAVVMDTLDPVPAHHRPAVVHEPDAGRAARHAGREVVDHVSLEQRARRLAEKQAPAGQVAADDRDAIGALADANVVGYAEALEAQEAGVIDGQAVERDLLARLRSQREQRLARPLAVEVELGIGAAAHDDGVALRCRVDRARE